MGYQPLSVWQWLTHLHFLIIFSISVVALLIYLRRRASLEEARRQALQAANDRLRLSQADLERRVARRTRDLQIAMDVSKKVTTILNLDELLTEIVQLILDHFDLYHMSIFLYDENRQGLRLAVSTSPVNKKMVNSILFPLNSDRGLIPLAGRTRRPVLVNDVQQSPHFFPNPYLPDTQAELVIPMLVGQRLIGVLDLESTHLNRFSEDELSIMTSLAEQLAIAIHNTQLFTLQAQAVAELRELDSLKNQFLASVSHELRTPLNAVINFTQFVTAGLYGPVNEQQADALLKVTDSARHLLGLINDVLDMSKIEAGRLELVVEEDVRLQAELEAICETAVALLQNKPVTLRKEMPPNLPPVPGDRKRIRQILLNLVSNAAKFTEQGCIQLRAWPEDGQVVVAVADTGPGIAPEDQAAVFEPFRQLRHHNEMAGTGLGLPISRRLAEAHGGRLWLESAPGQGATFYVALPAKTAVV
ncbi:MAG: GAF domain-containing sensor histidine kinase [Anaerolineales bacterium]|nr:GAF domain-containing sensor histidine kinase [Anaerolineales bacterium]